MTILFSDRGTPDGYRFMNGYSSHTLRLVSKEGQASLVKFHFKTDQGIRNLTREQAAQLASADPDHATRDLFEAIKRGEHPSWTVYLQVMPESHASKYSWNVLDVTKVWPHGDYPLQPIGKLVLNRNPVNYFAETEQSAFSPSHLVPGIEASHDKMLQGRLFSYPDTHRHRLGANYTQIPINRPLQCPRLHHQQRDGPMCVDGNQGSAPNYEPNSQEPNTTFAKASNQAPVMVNGPVGRHAQPITDKDFKQPAALYRLQSPAAQERLLGNLAVHLKGAKPHLRRRQLAHFKRADPQWAQRLQAELVKQTGGKL